MDLLLGTLVLRPYVFGFLAAFLLAGRRDLGWRRTLRFAACVSPVAWLAEMSSIRTGVPFGLYHYTGETRGRELFLADVPLMDPLSFSFLAYAAFCLARAALAGRRVPAPGLALATGVLMMLLDVVIDPVAVRGERWFLGRLFFYAEEGIYFGVPVSNFAGWVLVGTVGTLLFCWSGARGAGLGRGWPDRGAPGSDTSGRSGGWGARGSDTSGRSGGWGARGSATSGRSGGWGAAGSDAPGPPAGAGAAGPGVPAAPVDPYGRRTGPGIALYYAVLAFNLAVTAWLAEWLLLLAGLAVHVVTAAALWTFLQRPVVRPGLEKQRA